MILSAVQVPVYQMHSRDYFLRVFPHEAEAIVWHHLATVEDPDALQGVPHCPGARGGFTEWHGQLRNDVTSLAWDWVRLPDGHVRLQPAVAPRTNLRLLDSRGYDLLPDTEKPFLLRLVDGLPWQAEVARLIG